MQKRSIHSPIVVLVLLSLSMSFLPLAIVLPVEACGTNTPCNNGISIADNGPCTPGSTCGLAATSLYEGDTLVFIVLSGSNTVTVQSMTDTKGTTYAKDIAKAGNLDIEIWHGVITAVCSLCSSTVTATYTGSQTGGYGVLLRYRGTANLTWGTNSGTGASSNPISLPSFSSPTNTFLVVGTVFGSAKGHSSWGSGLTNQNVASVKSGTYYMGVATQFSSTAVTMNPSETLTGNDNYDIVYAAYTDSIGSVTTIGPCNFFQLQCWWYPLLFMTLYSGVLLLVASMLGTSSKGKAHVFLSAVTFGSLIAVILGIMNIAFPLIMLVINTIIALRLKG